jgi:outer membrane protein
MKNASLILSSLSFIGVLILFSLHFRDKKNNTGKGSSSSSVHNTGGAFKVAYVDLDSFNAHYETIKSKRVEFERDQTQMEAELERAAQQYQNNLQNFQKKVQSGNISQSEGEATQRKLLQMQESLRLREQALNDQFIKKKEAYNNELQSAMDSFLQEYNKGKGYDYILSYSRALNLFLYANKDFDITEDVIKGMNKKNQKMSDTSGKK